MDKESLPRIVYALWMHWKMMEPWRETGLPMCRVDYDALVKVTRLWLPAEIAVFSHEFAQLIKEQT